MSVIYAISLSREFSVEENVSGLIDEYILGAWEDKVPKEVFDLGEWLGHGQEIGWPRLMNPWKRIFSRPKSYIRSYDFSIQVKSLEAVSKIVELLTPEVEKDEMVTIRITGYLDNTEEE
jgi:hypothetical protein